MNKINKILYLTPHLSTGGLPQYLYKKLEIISKDNDVYLVEWEDIAPIYKVQKDLIKSIIPEKKFIFWEQGTDINFKIKYVRNFIRGLHFDIIHIEEFPEFFLPDELINYIYNSDRTYKIIETSHNSRFSVQDKRVIPDSFVFVSTSQIEKFKELKVSSYLAEYPLERKIRPDREVALKALELDPEFKHVLNVGLFTSGKNQGYIFEIAYLLKTEKIQFHFIGNQAPNFKEYWEPLMQNKPFNCIVHGECSNVDTWYSACDLLLFPSKSELNPLVPREAISWGLPVLMTYLDIYQHEYDKYVKYLTNDLFKDSLLVLDSLKSNLPKLAIVDQKESFANVLKDVYNNVEKNVDDIQPEQRINFNFIDGPFVEVLNGEVDAKYNIAFYDETNRIVHQDTLPTNHYTKCYRKWFTNWIIKVKSEDKLVFEHKFDLKNKKILISLESSALGDTIAWIPYVEEFRLKHDCKVFCSTFWNKLYKNSYPEINFIKPGEVVHNIYASYKIGAFNPADSKMWHPVDWRTIPLQKIASDILGLEYREIKPKIDIPDDLGTSEGDVCISIHSSCQAKYWNHQNGWQKVVSHLVSNGYKVMHISKESGTYMGNIAPYNALDKTGDHSIKLRIKQILNSKLFIGVSSGLSWLAWALGVPTIMISGVTKSFLEPSDMLKIHNDTVCNGCFNTTSHIFDKGNWNWCPENQNFICSKSISPETVIEKINEVLSKQKESFDFNQYIHSVEINNNDTVLDLGCSDGDLYFGCMQNQLDINYIGVDASIFTLQDFVKRLDGNNTKLLNLMLNDSQNIVDFSCMFHSGLHQYTQAMTFKNLLDLINRPIDFLKFDIEGYEKYIFEDYDFFKANINKFAGEIHFVSEVFPKEDVYNLLLKLKQDPYITFTLFSTDMIDITESIINNNNNDYYTEIIINGRVLK